MRPGPSPSPHKLASSTSPRTQDAPRAHDSVQIYSDASSGPAASGENPASGSEASADVAPSNLVGSAVLLCAFFPANPVVLTQANGYPSNTTTVSIESGLVAGAIDGLLAKPDCALPGGQVGGVISVGMGVAQNTSDGNVVGILGDVGVWAVAMATSAINPGGSQSQGSSEPQGS